MPDVLVLCTANQCRSPMAAALLRALAPGLDVASAGRLRGDLPAQPGAVAALAARALPLDDHRSLQADRRLVAASALIVGMAREHVRDAVLLDATAGVRAFTLKDLVRRGGPLGPRRPGEPLATWLGWLAAGRVGGDLLGASPADDVADPIGRPTKAFVACADELEGLLRRLVDLAFPLGVADLDGSASAAGSC